MPIDNHLPYGLYHLHLLDLLLTTSAAMWLSAHGSALQHPGIDQSAMLSLFAVIMKTVFAITPTMTIGAMPREAPGQDIPRAWRSGKRDSESESESHPANRRRQSRRHSPSGDHSDTPPPSANVTLDIHDEESDLDINNPTALAERIELNIRTMSQCKATFDSLAIRNEKLKQRHRAMMGHFTPAPAWGAASSSADEPMSHSATAGIANKMPIPAGACRVTQASAGTPVTIVEPPPAPKGPPAALRHFDPPPDIRNQQTFAEAMGTGKGGRPIATRGPGIAKGKHTDNPPFKGDKGKGKDKSNINRTNPGLPIGAMGAGTTRWLNEERLALVQSDDQFVGNPRTIEQLRNVAVFIANLVPDRSIDNRLMADSNVNCAVVYTGLPWHSPETDCLKDIMTFGGILVAGHPGIHYVQLNKNEEGINTWAAFIGWVNRELAIASISMFSGYQGIQGTSIEATFNRNGNPHYHSSGRRHGNPRRDADMWTFPEPLPRERANPRSPWGSPTFIHN